MMLQSHYCVCVNYLPFLQVIHKLKYCIFNGNIEIQMSFQKSFKRFYNQTPCGIPIIFFEKEQERKVYQDAHLVYFETCK